MKSRAIVHSRYESRLRGTGQQGGSLPSGGPATLLAGRPQGRLATEQAPAQSVSAGHQPQPVRTPRT